MSNQVNFVEFATSHLKSINSKYTLDSVILITTVIDRILAKKEKKISTSDIILNTPPVLLREYGYLWNIVLSKSKIETWEDFGNVVFICVDLGIFKKTEEDKLEDFIDAEKTLALLQDCNFLEDEAYITTEIKHKK